MTKNLYIYYFLFILAWVIPIKNSFSQTFTLKELKPGIYRSQHNRHFGVVVEGKNSLLIFDTINADFSRWLNQELKKRFGKPVKYVIYSHNHPDHISGGKVFLNHQPIYISHQLAKESMERMQTNTYLPDITFDKALEIDLDGIKILLNYWGKNDGQGSISMYIPKMKFITAIDWALTDRVGYRNMERYDVEGMIRSLKAIDQLDWDLISPGHSGIGNKNDLRRYRRYLETIHSNILSGLRSRMPENEIIASTKESIKEFRDLKMFDEWSEMNIRGIYRQLTTTEGLTN